VGCIWLPSQVSAIGVPIDNPFAATVSPQLTIASPVVWRLPQMGIAQCRIRPDVNSSPTRVWRPSCTGTGWAPRSRARPRIGSWRCHRSPRGDGQHVRVPVAGAAPARRSGAGNSGTSRLLVLPCYGGSFGVVAAYAADYFGHRHVGQTDGPLMMACGAAQ
jgi:hypothetical protein